MNEAFYFCINSGKAVMVVETKAAGSKAAGSKAAGSKAAGSKAAGSKAAGSVEIWSGYPPFSFSEANGTKIREYLLDFGQMTTADMTFEQAKLSYASGKMRKL